MNYLNESLDNLEQSTRYNNGVPETSYESTEEVILKIVAALAVPSDIESSHKLRRKSDKSNIIAKYCRTYVSFK